MFIVQLRFADNRGEAGRLLDGHRAWLKRGFDDGVFLLAGRLQPDLGGGILAHNTSLEALQGRVADDPYVAGKVVSAEIVEMTPALADARLGFLVEG